MKTFRSFILLGLVAIVFANCKKDSNNDFEGIRVSINGSEWVAPTTAGAAQGDNLSITGADPATFKTILLVLPANVVAGTYNIEAFGDVQISYTGGSASLYTPKSGKVVVTEHNTAGKRIKGTFEFEGEDAFNGGTASFKDGEFNVAYQ